MHVKTEISDEQHAKAIEAMRGKTFQNECTQAGVFLYQIKRYQIQALPDWLSWNPYFEESFEVDYSKVLSEDMDAYSHFAESVDIEELEIPNGKDDPDGKNVQIADSDQVTKWLSKTEIPGSELNSTYAVEWWDTHRAYITREEAEDFGRYNVHNQKEWRVYCVPGYGVMQTVVESVHKAFSDPSKFPEG